MIDRFREILEAPGREHAAKGFCYLTFAASLERADLCLDRPLSMTHFLTFGRNFERLELEGPWPRGRVVSPSVLPKREGASGASFVFNFTLRERLRFLSAEDWPSLLFLFKDSRNTFYFARCFVPKGSRRVNAAVHRVLSPRGADPGETFEGFFLTSCSNADALERLVVENIGSAAIEFHVSVENTEKFGIRL